MATAAMDEATRSAWSREQGLYPAELDAWKQDAIAGLGEPRAASAVEARQDRRRVKELERELHRKDKVRKSGLDSPDSVERARYFPSDGQAALPTTASMPSWRCVGEVKPRSRGAGRRRCRA